MRSNFVIHIYCQSRSSLLLFSFSFSFIFPLGVIFFVGLIVLTFCVAYLSQLWGQQQVIGSFHSHQPGRRELKQAVAEEMKWGWGSSTFMEFNLE